MAFDSLARSYQTLEYLAFAPDLQKMRTHFVADCSSARNVLLAGEGDGRFLAELTRQQPEAHIDCLDASARMLARARERLAARGLGENGRIQFIQSDLRTHELVENKYDLLVTHFFLDCFSGDTLGRLVPRLAASARPGALWLLSDFALPPCGWRRFRAQIWLKFLYAFFKIFTRIETGRLVDARELLRQNGWRCRSIVTAQQGLLYASLWKKTEN